MLVNNLCINIKPMYRLYCILKDREEPSSHHEITYASGKKKFDRVIEAEYLKKLASASNNIKKAFEDQQAWAGVYEAPSSFIY